MRDVGPENVSDDNDELRDETDPVPSTSVVTNKPRITVKFVPEANKNIEDMVNTGKRKIKKNPKYQHFIM